MLTAAQVVDVRRYCGYPLSASAALPGTDPVVAANSATLDAVLAALAPEQEAVVATVYLANLSSMENAIPGAGANLDTAKAAVWTHNPQELADRQALFFSWRQQLAAFLGVAAGPGIYAPTSLASGGIVPAVFAV